MDVKNIHNVNLSRKNKNSINITYAQPFVSAGNCQHFFYQKSARLNPALTHNPVNLTIDGDPGKSYIQIKCFGNCKHFFVKKN